MLLTICAILTAIAAAAALRPLLGRREAVGADAAAPDQLFYLDQLAAIERDARDGRLGPAEAEAARVEVARRLLAADRRIADRRILGGARLLRPLAVIVVLAALVGAAPLYLALGRPSLPPQPLDARGWDVAAMALMMAERPREAAEAWRTSIGALGSNAEREAARGEALFSASGGKPTPEVREAFAAALARDPTHVKARFYVGVLAERDGDRAGAAREWRAILADLPADSDLRAPIQTAISRLEAPRAASAPAQAAAPGAAAAGPGPADLAAAAAMSDTDRQAMIDRMVSGLAERLESAPNDPEGWLRLVRAYSVLGRKADAEKAVASAMKGLSTPADREAVAALASQLGLSGTGAVTQ